MNRFKLMGVTALAAVTAVAFATDAEAGLTMRITDSLGFDSGIINDGDDGSVDGIIAISGNTGLFNFDLQSTTSSSPDAFLNSVSQNFTSTGAGTLTVEVIDDSFTNPSAGNREFETDANASAVTGSSSIDVESFIDGAHLLNTTINSVADTPVARDSFLIASPFSISHVYTVTATASGQNISFDVTTQSVPEPATLGLLGAGLAGVGLAMRRRRQKVAA